MSLRATVRSSSFTTTRSTRGTRTRETRFTVHWYVSHLSFLSSLASYRPEVSVKADYYIPRSGNLSPSDLCSASRARSRRLMTTRMMGSSRAYDVVQYDGIRRPQHLDIHGVEALLEVKNGLTTGTIVGHATGLDSFTRTHTKYGIKHTSIGRYLALRQTAWSLLLPSESEDSGSLNRAARIVGLLKGARDVWLSTRNSKSVPFHPGPAQTATSLAQPQIFPICTLKKKHDTTDIEAEAEALFSVCCRLFGGDTEDVVICQVEDKVAPHGP